MRWDTLALDVMRSKRFAMVLSTGIALAGVASAHADEDNPGWADRLGESFKNGVSSATKAVGLGKPAPPPAKESPSGCPTIAILDGTTSSRVMAPGATGNEGLKYQYSLLNVGRECSTAGARMSVKIGANGRVLLGPAGTSGHFEVPIRIVIVSTIDGKPVESKLYRVSANVASGQPSVPYDFVSESILVPIGAGKTGDDYAIKVGIDGGKSSDVGAKVTKVHRRRAAKTAESAAR